MSFTSEIQSVVRSVSPRPTTVLPAQTLTTIVEAMEPPIEVPMVVPTQETQELPEEIISLLGEAKKSELPLGVPVPAEISKRWGKILVEGLEKEQKEALFKQMLMPENFQLAYAPKLNAEVSTVLSESARNRDKRLEKSQNQLGSGIAGLVNLTKDLVQSDMDKLAVIKRISEISQILLDLHYEETVNRRKLIIPMLDKKFFNTIQGVKRDSYLFGEKLGENIKNTNEIEKSSKQIKKPFFNQPVQRKNNNVNPAGNLRAPLRQQTAFKTSAATGYQNPQASSSRRPIKTRNQAVPSSRNRDHRRK